MTSVEIEIPLPFQELLRPHLPYAGAGPLAAGEDLAALGLDSMAVVQLLSDVEAEFGVELPDEILDELMDATRAAGLRVTSETSGLVAPLSPGVDLTAYRIIQEALTNAVRHAPGATACVRVTYEPSHISVEVTNGCSASPVTPRGPVGAVGHGYGLAGIAERVASCGGALSLGPTGDGGFAMTAPELSVASRLGLGLVVVVFADGGLNRIELHQASVGYPLAATAVDRTDIPLLAESLGCDGIRVDSVSGLEKALSGAWGNGRTRPLVIEARIDTAQYSAQF